jgi:hypothetical protein
VFHALSLFDALDRLALLAMHPILDWLITLLNVFDVNASSGELLTQIVKGAIRNPGPPLTPFFLTSLIATSENHHDYLNCLGNALRQQRDRLLQYEPFFTLFLIHVYCNWTDPALRTQAARMVMSIFFLINKSIFAQFQEFVGLVFVHFQIDLSPFLRFFYSEVLPTCHSLPFDISQDQFDAFYESIFNFISRIPQFDPFYSLPLSFAPEGIPKLQFQEMLNVFYRTTSVKLEYTFATRTTMDGEWIDSDMAMLLIQTICEQPIPPSSERTRFRIISRLISSGLQHRKDIRPWTAAADDCINLLISANFVETKRDALPFLLAGFGRRIDPESTKWFLEGRMALIREHFVDLLAFGQKRQGLEFVHSFVEEVSHKEAKCFKSYTPIDLPLFKVKTVQPSTFIGQFVERIEEAFEAFAINLKGIKQRSIRKYRRLHESLSLDNGPWSTPEIDQCVHLKLENSIFKFSLRVRMKPNLRFQGHRDASLVRDLGSLQTATEICKSERKTRHATRFNPDFVLTQFEEDDGPSERLQTPGRVRQKYAVEMITPTAVYTGNVWFTDAELFFDSPKRMIELPIHRTHKMFVRRWLHSETALEIYIVYSKAFFLNFPEGNRNSFLKRLLNQRPAMLKYCQKTAADAKQLALKATKKWQEGHLSNFEYLMKLNIYGDRSYNDLSQYPVFPWVIQDYASSELALGSPEVYRDLSLPVGALNAERLENVRQNHDSATDPDSYLFGSLYSSSAVVLEYLIRVEPFTSLHISLQGGRFDYADRLFTSIPECWQSLCSQQPDYRELIPEFFNFPDFLVNHNHFDLGILSSNVPVNDVALPPWAKSPLEFIDLNRAALESPFVTAKLNRWVDLIFGPSSRGPGAVAANTTFHPYFYNTALTPQVMKSPRDLRIIKEYALCFGSVPGQLFDDQPPARDFYVFGFGRELLPYSNIRQFSSLSADGKFLLAVTATLDFVIFRHRDERLRGRFDFLYPTAHGVLPFFAMSRFYAAVCFSSCPAFHIFAVRGGHCAAVAIARGHTKPVTSLAVYEKWIVSASEDCSLRLWPGGSEDPHRRIRLPRTQPIVIVRIRPLFQEVVAISRNGFLSVSSLSTKRYLKGVQLGSANPSDMIVSSGGLIVVAFRGPGSFLIVVAGVNLEILAERNVDGTLACWTAVVLNGIDYLVIAIANRIRFLRLPVLEAVSDGERELAIVPAAMTFVRKDRTLYIAGGDKKLFGIAVGRIV